MVVPKGGGGSRWHKIAMWQMHITPSLCLAMVKIKFGNGGQGGDKVEFMLEGWAIAYRSCLW